MPLPAEGGALIGYARVSTSEQDVGMQVAALHEAGCHKIFEDVASGAKAARPRLEAALAYLRPGDTLVVWKIDRLGRSLAHLIALVEDLRERGIGFRSLTNQGLNTTTPDGILVFRIFAALAEFECELIRERTRAGMRRAKEKGVRLGPRRKITDGMLVKADKLVAKGLSVRQAAGAIGISKTGLYRALNERDAASKWGGT